MNCWKDTEFTYCKLEIFIPESHLEALQKALQKADAGHIGNYDSCMSVSKVTGYWRPLDGCNPYIGENGKISSEPEAKVEVTIFAENADRTIAAIKAVHPYEEPVINAIPIWKTSF
ncbi:MAG: YqfO family protein [Lachnospiraceae bacterium]|nr:YqfO family protein [Lachnospiraceae bacterium]